MIENVLNGRKIILDGKMISRIIGVDMGAKMPIVSQHGEYIVFRRNGFTGWAGVGFKNYYHPVYCLIIVKNGIISCVLDEIEANRQNWREVSRRLVSKAALLNGEADVVKK